MFNIKTNIAARKSQWYRIGDRLEIKGATALLAHRQFRFYIEQLRERSGLPGDHFHHFYQAFIERFAELVQVIPEEPNAQLGSFLKNGLVRGLNTLHYFVSNFNNPSPLERYALFTACVLRDISHIITGQKIYITDNQGATLKVWQPFCGPLTEEVEGNSYKIFPRAQIFDRINKSIRVTLARQVMGENGFLAIASDLHLFAEWIEALAEDDEEGSGRLVKVIKAYRRNGGGLIDNFPLDEIEILESPATELADQFYVWLQDGLRDGSIAVNTSDANVHITDMGIFIEAGIFKDFAKLYNLSSNYAVVYAQFGNLIGIAKKGSGDFLHAALFSDYPDQTGAAVVSPFSHKGKMREGVLITDAAGMYGNGKMPDSSPHIKLPASMRKNHQQLADFNVLMHPNNALKNK